MCLLPAVTLTRHQLERLCKREPRCLDLSVCGREGERAPGTMLSDSFHIFLCPLQMNKGGEWEVGGRGGLLSWHYRAYRPVVKLNARLSAASRSTGAVGHFSSAGLCKERLRGPDVCPRKNSLGFFFCVSPGPLFQLGTPSYFCQNWDTV